MKVYLILIFLFPIQLIAQIDLIGKFCSPPSMAVQCITFHADSTFEEQFHGCLISPSNIGTFRKKENYLELTFDDHDTSKSSFTTEQINSNAHSKDSVDLFFKIIDANSFESLPFVTLTVLAKNNSYYTSDFDGNINLRVRTKDQQIPMKITYVGFQPFFFNVEPNTSKSLRIGLKNHLNKIPNGTVWKYRIVKDKSNRLTLKRKKSSLILSKIES